MEFSYSSDVSQLIHRENAVPSKIAVNSTCVAAVRVTDAVSVDALHFALRNVSAAGG
jgi:hypothetical protein